MGELRLALTFTYGLYGYGYSPQLRPLAASATPEDFVSRSLTPRINPPPERTEGVRAVLVPRATPHPTVAMLPTEAYLSSGVEFAAVLREMAEEDRRRFPLLQQAMSKLPRLRSELAGQSSRAGRLGWLRARVEGLGATDNAHLTTIEHRFDTMTHAPRSYLDFVEPSGGTGAADGEGGHEGDATRTIVAEAGGSSGGGGGARRTRRYSLWESMTRRRSGSSTGAPDLGFAPSEADGAESRLFARPRPPQISVPGRRRSSRSFSFSNDPRAGRAGGAYDGGGPSGKLMYNRFHGSSQAARMVGVQQSGKRLSRRGSVMVNDDLSSFAAGSRAADGVAGGGIGGESGRGGGSGGGGSVGGGEGRPQSRPPSRPNSPPNRGGSNKDRWF